MERLNTTETSCWARCWEMAPSHNDGPRADRGPTYCPCCDVEPCSNTQPCLPEQSTITGYCQAPKGDS